MTLHIRMRCHEQSQVLIYQIVTDRRRGSRRRRDGCYPVVEREERYQQSPGTHISDPGRGAGVSRTPAGVPVFGRIVFRWYRASRSTTGYRPQRLRRSLRGLRKRPLEKGGPQGSGPRSLLAATPFVNANEHERDDSSSPVLALLSAFMNANNCIDRKRRPTDRNAPLGQPRIAYRTNLSVFIRRRSSSPSSIAW
jgi:hypothetical protein